MFKKFNLLMMLTLFLTSCSTTNLTTSNSSSSSNQTTTNTTTSSTTTSQNTTTSSNSTTTTTSQDEKFGTIIFNENTINGSIRFENYFNNSKVSFNTKINVVVNPDVNYELDTLTVNGLSIKSTLSFIVNEEKDYYVDATFKKIGEEEKFATIKIDENIQNGNVEFVDFNNTDEVKLNTKVDLKITPDTNYELDTLTVNGISIKSSLSFIAQEEITYLVSASFKYVASAEQYATIKINENIKNGVLKFKNYENNSKVSLNTKVEIEVIPDNDYELDTLTVNGISIKSSKFFIVEEYIEYVVNATFKYIGNTDKYATISISNDIENGSVKFKGYENNSSVLLGSKIEVIAIPNDGYKLSSLEVNGTSILSTLSFIINEEKQYLITASFIKDEPILNEVTGSINFVNLNTNGYFSLQENNLELNDIEISSVTSSNLYKDSNEDSFRTGTSKGATIEFEFASTISIVSIELIVKQYSDDDPEITLTLKNFTTSLKSLTQKVLSNNVYIFNTDNVTNLELKTNGNNRAVLYGINIIYLSNKEPVKANLTINKTGEGEVSVTPNTNLFVGDYINVKTSPNNGYFVSSITLNGNSGEFISSNNYKFRLTQENNVLSVIFKEQTSHNDNYDYLYANNTIYPTRGNQGNIDSYYEPVRGLKGAELKQALHNIIDDHTTFGYGELDSSDFNLIDEDPFNSNNYILMYEGSYPKSTDMNKEHVWAKSHGNFDTRIPEGSDLNNLHPCNNWLNSCRGNLDFGFVGEENDNLDHSKPQFRSTMIGNYRNSSYFEPKDEFKGDIARTIFYMAVRYEGDSGEKDLEVGGNIDNTLYNNFTSGANGIHGDFAALYQWATSGQDPVSDYEVNRNNNVDQYYQHNRNPFIDHPEFLIMIYDKNYNGPGALM